MPPLILVDMRFIKADFKTIIDNKGFSLIELLIIIVLLILLAAFAVPNVAKVMPRYRLKEAARFLFQDFQLAKATAIKEGVACTVEFLNSGYQIFIDLNENLIRDGSETANRYLIKQVNWSEYKDVQVDTTKPGNGITFALNSNGNKAVAFLPSGLTKDSSGGFGAGTVYLKSTSINKGMKVIVGNTGTIRIE